jgi:hypothetical protein
MGKGCARPRGAARALSGLVVGAGAACVSQRIERLGVQYPGVSRRGCGELRRGGQVPLGFIGLNQHLVTQHQRPLGHRKG